MDALGRFNALPEVDAEATLLKVCASSRWAQEVAGGRPYADAEALYAAADHALGDADLDAALAGHPRIGERTTDANSRREQAGVTATQALAEGNHAYEQKFGHVYLVCATGRTGEELLAILQERLGNDPTTERGVVRDELRKINRLRLARLLNGETL